MLGKFIGPTVLSDVKEDIECSKEEILGPVLLCMQVCINTAVPAPLPLFSLTGSEFSFFGNFYVNGKPGVHFHTQVKTVTQQWRTADTNVKLPSK